MFTKESLDALKEKIDLVEVVQRHLDLKRAGSAYKACCPFHQEKTPSFVIQKGDSHYHCYGCQAHGDAIQFLMHHLTLTFREAIEQLAEQFQVPLVEAEHASEERGISKSVLKEALATATRFFHEYLVGSLEGREPLRYLFRRGITIDFIRRFQVGFAPAQPAPFQRAMAEAKVGERVLVEVGLVSEASRLPFFRNRILFPVCEASGPVVGFSGRKIHEETFGGKYINSTETPLFKKSRLLFGLNYSRRRIAKERRVIFVEGQIDCLRLIESGLDLTVAALGTACGEGHVALMKQLGVRHAYLLFDGDKAGQAAASKAGDLLQREGIEVSVGRLPSEWDPDAFIRKYGIEKVVEVLEKAESYLTFQVGFLSQEVSLDSPAGKSEIVKTLKQQVEGWQDPVMVHESVRKLASLLHIPEATLGIVEPTSSPPPLLTRGRVSAVGIDPHRIMERDLLHWLILMRARFLPTAKEYLREAHFWVPSCRLLFQRIMQEEVSDFMDLASDFSDIDLLDEMMQKKVNRERADTHFLESIQKLLDRQWMEERAAIRREMAAKAASGEEIGELVRAFAACARPVALFSVQ